MGYLLTVYLKLTTLWLSNMLYLKFIAVLTIVIAGVLLPLSILMLRLTLDRRVRKQLPKDKDYGYYPDWYCGFGRTIIFGCASVWDRANDSWQMKLFYGGFDVKSFANCFEKFMTYCLFFSLIVLCGGGAIYALLEFFGVIVVK